MNLLGHLGICSPTYDLTLMRTNLLTWNSLLGDYITPSSITPKTD